MFKSLLLGLSFLCFVFSVSQITSGVPLLEYKAAKALYDKSTALSTSPLYSEKKEIALNQEALQRFKYLHRKLNGQDFWSDSLSFHVCYYIGELEHYFDRQSEAQSWYRQAIDQHQKSELPDSLLFKPFVYSGIIAYNQNKLDSAAIFFHRADSISQKYPLPLQESQRLYNTWGVLSYETGNYRLAKNYFSKALEVLSPDHPYYTDLRVNYQINQAQVHVKLEEYDDANKIYQQLLPLNKNRDEIFLNLGLINLNLGVLQVALSWFRKISPRNNKPIRRFNHIGNAFLALKQYDSAKHYFDKAMASAHSGNIDYQGYGLTLKSLGDLEVAKGYPEKALSHYAAAIHRFYPAFADTAITANPEKFSGVFSYISLFDVLLAKADALHRLYKKNGQLSWANEELKTYQSAFALVEYVGRTYNSDEARMFINRIKYEAHNFPIDIAFELYSKTGKKTYLEALYQFDQQNKASILALNQQLIEQRPHQDNLLWQHEKNLKTVISRLSFKAAQLTDSIGLEALNKQIRDNEILLAKVQKQMEGKTTGTVRIPSIESLQQELLDPSTALVSYHLSTDKLTTLTISRKDVHCSQRTLPSSFHQEIAAFIQSARSPGEPDASAISKKLSGLLLAHLGKEINRLLIISDDELNYLPFESLQDASGQYLIQRYSVQYQYSTATLKKETMDFSDHRTLSFAPFAGTASPGGIDSFAALPNSGKEVESLKGKRFVNATATITAFLHHVTQYKVVHLATHAVAGENDYDSFIAFSRDSSHPGGHLLHTSEIYNLSLTNTGLVILSACESGAGSLVRGEGVMSLSRAFAYAGSPNIITTLWKADDFSTAYLTQKIHHYLDKDYSIDRAVQQAKVDYLSDAAINPRLKHPFYWSHLVFIGSYQPASFSLHWYLAGSAVLIILGLGTYFHFRRRTFRNRL